MRPIRIVFAAIPRMPKLGDSGASGRQTAVAHEAVVQLWGNDPNAAAAAISAAGCSVGQSQPLEQQLGTYYSHSITPHDDTIHMEGAEGRALVNMFKAAGLAHHV